VQRQHKLFCLGIFFGVLAAAGLFFPGPVSAFVGVLAFMWAVVTRLLPERTFGYRAQATRAVAPRPRTAGSVARPQPGGRS
jgi:hypothetical protein